MSRYHAPPTATGFDVPAELLIEAKSYAMANRRLELRALGERVASIEPMAEPPHEAPRRGRARSGHSFWRGAMQFAQERTKFLILCISR